MKDNQTAAFFSQYSNGFNAIYNTGTGFFQRLINKWFRQTMFIRFQKTMDSCFPTEGKKVLDVGCGPGLYCIALAKKGIELAHGIDFAPGMIAIAKNQARAAGVDRLCSFEKADFTKLSEDTKYNYVVVMGFMDYMSNPKVIIEKAMRLATDKVLFSFPSDAGFLAWQRKIRYKFKCPLFLYNLKQLNSLFTAIDPWTCKIESIGRDFFVTLERKNSFVS